MVALKPSRTLTALPVLGIFILQPSTALASGDPLVLFSMLGIALIQALLAGFILLAKSCSGFRMPVMGVYLSVVVVVTFNHSHKHRTVLVICHRFKAISMIVRFINL